MKKIFKVLLVLACLVIVPLFSACQDSYKGMKIEVDKTSVVIYLGQTPNDEVTVTATVSGSKTVCESIFSATSNKIQITSKYLGEGRTQATIKGLEPCLNSEIKVQTKENNKVTYFNVSVVQPITGLQLKDNAVNYGIFDESQGKTTTDFELKPSLFKFTPENNTQTELSYQLMGTYNADDIVLEDNILRVKNSQTPITVKLRAMSTHDQNVYCDFTYVLLPNIKVETITIDEEPAGEENTLHFIKNNLDEAKRVISFTVNQISGYPISIEPVINTDTVVLTNSSVLQSGKQSIYTFTLSAGLVGSASSIRFNAHYDNYNQVSNKVLEIESLTYEEVKDIIVYRENNQNQVFDNFVTVYNQYSSLENDVPGLKLIFEAYPISVPDKNKKLLLNINELQDNFYFYDANKNLISDLEDNYEISSGNYIYVRAKNVDSTENVLKIVSKDYPEVVKELTLNRQVGVSELSFLLNGQEIDRTVLITNSVESQEIELVINENAEFGNLKFEQVGDGFTYVYNETTHVITISSVVDSVDQNGKLTVIFDNYFSKSLNIETFKQLTNENVIVSTESSLENIAVSVYKKNSDGSANTVVVKNGNSIELNIDTENATVLNTTYKFIDIEELKEDNDYSTLTVDTAQTSSKVVSIFDGHIISTAVGYVKIFVLVEGYELKDGEKQVVTIEKSFLVEVYKPLISLELDKYQLPLYSKNSLSAYDENLYEEEVGIKINGEVAPENLSYELNYTQYSNENFVIELLEEEKSNYRLKITALNYDENSANPIIVVSVTEKYGLVKNKGITLQKRLNVSISEAIKLNNIEVTNVSENGIYVDLTTSNTSMIQLLTKTYPLNALNSNLIYTFIPDIDTNSSILSVDNNGLIRLSEEKMGGSGYIKIVPEDCYTYDEDGDLVEDFRNNTSNLVKLVRVFIADGKTEKTAKRIYNLAEILNDTTLHYSLMRNVEISNDILNIEFSGGLYGNLNGNGGKVTIALKNASLFKKLTQGAVVKNISITGTTTNDGFVASVNDGSIINVSVDADISEGTYNPSTINSLTENAGGIAGENNGIIENSTFSGSISGSSLVNAGGIAGINNGTIKNSTFYAYNYSLGFNSITATNVGLITAVNNQYAVVENCNSILYGVADDYSNVILGTEVEISEVNKQVIEPINIDFANISIQNSNNSIKEKDARAVLFYYATVGETLSTEEKNIVSSWNVIEYKDLFLNYNENMIVVANSNLVTTNANSLTINGVGEIVLTILNKTNFAQQKTINVLISYPIVNFEVSYDGYILSNDTTLKVKVGSYVTFKTSILTQNIAVNRSLKLKTNSNLLVNNTATLGAYSLQIQDNSVVPFVLNFVNIDGNTTKFEDYNSVLSQNSVNVIIDVYKGADFLSVNSNSISFEPINSGSLFVEMNTDMEDDGLFIQIRDSLNNIVYDNTVDGEYDFETVITTNKVINGDNYRISFDIEVLIKEESRIKDFDAEGYTIIINALSLQNNYNYLLEKRVALKIEPQKIKRIEFLHYLLENNASNNKISSYSSEPVNTVTPGDTGLLNISLFPLYTKFDYVTITSPEVNGNQLSLRLLTKTGEDLKNANVNSFAKINDGFRLDYNVIKSMFEIENMGNFYIRTIVSSSVKVDVVFRVYVNIYANGTVSTFDYPLTTRYLQKPTIFVNGETKYTYVAKGTENQLSIYVPKTQTFDVANVSINPQEEATYLDSWELDSTSSDIYNIYTTSVYVGGLDHYQIFANVSWVINNKLQTSTEIFDIYALDLLVNSNGSGLNVNTENKYYFSSYIDIPKQLDIDLSLIYGESYANCKDKLLQNNYYFVGYNSSTLPMLAYEYIINYFDDVDYVNLKNDEYINPLRNLYIINGDEVLPVYNSTKGTTIENTYLNFEYNEELRKVIVTGKTTGVVALRYMLKVKMPNGVIRNIEFDFEIEVDVYTDEDTPRVIASVEDFMNIQNEEEQQDYILINDLVLDDYVPFNTSKIRTLDGNNKTINIRSFKIDEEISTLNLALFSEITSNTLIKNLRVNLSSLGYVQIDNSKHNNVQIAGLAIRNNGLITNSEVINCANSTAEQNAESGLIVNYQYENIAFQSTIAGFVINNGNTGSITNSRVGGEKIVNVTSKLGNTETVALKNFKISGQGNIAGFVYENNGLISSSFVSNAYIDNKTTQNYDSLTAGFVVYNRAGQINGSYVEGVANSSTEIHHSKYGITTLGISAGFVYQNSSKISDCYSNIKLTNNNNVGRSSAGFVYLNDANGSVYRSFSASLIKNATTTQMNFSGVDQNQEYLNQGIIENSYYFDENVKYDDNGQLITDSIEEYFDTPATRISVINNRELYYGFAFTYGNEKNGVWQITSTGPKLVSANNIAISSRYLIKLTEEQYVLPYVTGYDYGSINNPILIRTAEEFNEVFGNSERTPIQNYYDLESKTAFGSYRLVNNLDFSNFSSTTILNSSKMSLTAVKNSDGDVVSAGLLDGNGFTISNISMTADDSIQDSFGLFKEIKNSAVVKNLNIIVGKTDEYSNVYGVTAGDTACVGTLAGKLTEGYLSNIVVTAGVDGVVVAGQNIVGGVVGKVYKPGNMTNITVNNLSVIAYQTTIKNYVKTERDENFSYAGGLFGIITNDAEKSVTEAGLEDFNSDNKTFKVMGATKIVGGIAGGVTGYSGMGIHLQDVQYIFKNTEAEQSIIAYDGGYAGGVVGLLDGLLNQARSEYVANDKEELNDVFAYYNGVGELKKYRNIFYQADYSPKYIGGLVGYVRNKGEILRAYSKLNVINPNAEYVGGLVGYADTLKLTEAYATGDVSGENYVGGLAGGVKNNLNLDNVNALNVWSKDLNSRISQMKGFGALVGEKINNIVDSQFVKVNAVGKVSGSDNIPLVSNTDTNTKEEAAKNIDQTFTYVAENKQEIIDSSEYVFKITEGNFNPDKWEKDDNDLYLDMRFIVRNNVLYINEAEDLKLIKKYPTATFIITDMIDCRVFSINNKNFQIEYFAGVLKGKDVDKEYGFQNLELNNPLFNRVVNASFNNFTMKLTTDTTVDTNAVLVNYAKGIETDLLTFKNYKLNVSNEYSSVALVVANIESGNSSLNGLKLIGNEINITANNSKDLYAGLVFGRSEGSATLERLNIVNNVNEPSKTSNIIEIKSTEIKSIETFAAVENSSNIYAGLVGGKSSSISIINEADIEVENIISGKLTVEGAKNAYIGGIIGQTNTLNVNTTKLTVALSASKGTMSYVGGLAGNVNNTISISSVTLDDSSIYGYATKTNYVGGLVGNITATKFLFNQSSFINTKTMIAVGNEDIKSEKGYVGGLFGYCEFKDITDNILLNLATMYSRPSIETHVSDTLYAGGAFGQVIYKDTEKAYSITIQGIYYDGNIKDYSNKDVNIGGIAGGVEKVDLKQCRSYGDIYLQDTQDTEKISVEYVYEKAFVGGIVGYARGGESEDVKISITNCVSLTTIYNRLGVAVYKYGNGRISAIVPNYESVSFGNKATDTLNIYSNLVNLVSEKEEVGINKPYTDSIFSGVSKELFTIDGKEYEGFKANPKLVETIEEFNAVKELADINVKTYYSITKSNIGIEFNLDTEPVKLDKNVFVVGNGLIINNTGSARFGLFDEIPSGSAISGISYRDVDITPTDSGIGAFASLNKGVIYACNVVGKYDDDYIAKNSIKANSGVAGFVYKNQGYIADSFSTVNISAGSNIAGFVRENKGVIYNSYSSGKISNSDDPDSESSLATSSSGVEAFASGKLINCWTISQICHGTDDKGLEIFGSDANKSNIKNCWYDINATQCKSKNADAEILSTDEVSLNYAESNEISYTTTNDDGEEVLSLLGGNVYGSWGNDININYGYPAFIGGAYKDQKYMSVNKSIKDDIYLVSNLGKLSQISSKLDGKYRLINNLNGVSLVEGYDFVEIGPNAFTGEFNGGDLTISNLTTSGIFAKNEGNISELKLEDCIPSQGHSGLLINELISGSVSIINIIYKNDIVFENVYSFGGIANKMTGGKIDTSIITGTILKGSKLAGLAKLTFKDLKIEGSVGENTYFGGLVGYMDTLVDSVIDIKSSYSNINIKAPSVDSSTSEVYLGGIVGQIKNGELDEVANEGDLTGGGVTTNASFVGGIAGVGGNITNALNTGVITAEAIETSGEWQKEIEVKEKLPNSKDDYILTYIYKKYTKLAYASGISNSKADCQANLNNCVNQSKDRTTNIFGGYRDLIKARSISAKIATNVWVVIGAIIIAIIVAFLIIWGGGWIAGLAGAATTLGTGAAVTIKITFGLILQGAIAGLVAGGASYYVLSPKPQHEFSVSYDSVESLWEKNGGGGDEIGFYYLDKYEGKTNELNIYHLFIKKYSSNKDLVKDGKIVVGDIYSDSIANSSTITNGYTNVSKLIPIKFNEFEEILNNKNRNKANGKIDTYVDNLLISYYTYNTNEYSWSSSNETFVNEILESSSAVEQSKKAMTEKDIITRDGKTIYVVKTSGHFYWLINEINTKTSMENINIELDSDITLTGVINQISNFSGTFNGNGYTISNVGLSQNGLFKRLSGATIKNLNLMGVQSVHDSEYSGFLAELATNNTTVSNVYLNAKIVTTDVKYVGGVVGQVEGKSSVESLKVSNNTVLNAYTTTNDMYVGGIVGHVSAEQNKVIGSNFKGEINAQVISSEKPYNNISSIKITASGITNYQDKASNDIQNNECSGNVYVGSRKVEKINENLYYIPTSNSNAYTIDNQSTGVVDNNVIAYRPEKLNTVEFKQNIIEIKNQKTDPNFKIFDKAVLYFENNAKRYYIVTVNSYNDYCLHIDEKTGESLLFKITSNTINLDNYISIKGTGAQNYIIKEVSYKKTNNSVVYSNGQEKEYSGYQRETLLSYINYGNYQYYYLKDDNKELLKYNDEIVWNYTYIEQTYKITEYFNVGLENIIEFNIEDIGSREKVMYSNKLPYDEELLKNLNKNQLNYIFIMLKEVLWMKNYKCELGSVDTAVVITDGNISKYNNKCYENYNPDGNLIFKKNISTENLNSLNELVNCTISSNLNKIYFEIDYGQSNNNQQTQDEYLNKINLQFNISNGKISIIEDYTTVYKLTHVLNNKGLTSAVSKVVPDTTGSNTIFEQKCLFVEEGSQLNEDVLTTDELKQTTQYQNLSNRALVGDDNTYISLISKGNQSILRITKDFVNYRDIYYDENCDCIGFATYSLKNLEDGQIDIKENKYFVENYIWTDYVKDDKGDNFGDDVEYVYYTVYNDFIIKNTQTFGATFKKDNIKRTYVDSADSTVNTWTELTENVIVRTDIGVSYDIVNKNSSIQVGDYTVYRQKDGSMTVFYDNKLLYLQLNDDGYYETTINENLVVFEIAFDSYGDLNSAKLVN